MKPLIEFALRRQRLLDKLPPETWVIISNVAASLRNGDCYYPYRPRSDFYYLTGFTEPEAVALFGTTAQGPQFILFNAARDATQERWSGARTGQLGACMDYGADKAYPIAELSLSLPRYLAACQSVCFLFNEDTIAEQQIRHAMQHLSQTKGSAQRTAASQWINLAQCLHEMRLIKQPEEIEHIKQAVHISATAHQRAMQVCQPGLYEYEIEAALLHEFYRSGSRATAYDNIVATGSNACILHYHHNQSPLKTGQLLLIDAGCEYHYYASDITRSFPVNGRFTTEQRELYQIVLAAQEAAIQAIQPGVCWPELELIACRILTTGLVELGLLKGTVSKLLEQKAYRRFYPHSLGHWLGLDVHDVGHYQDAQGSRAFQANMVLTVEPGLYILPDNLEVDARWRGIGIRIEDDILVTETGCEVLSAAIPKKMDEIESFMQS